ncbi:Tyrosine-tRNA ligase [Venturia nashicola]|uniref:Cytoplasmic tyrosine-tRNA ligase n=1 Tax=Venturia nashicola TaxID=86259 RepID=A0A4Z1PGC1_9PEZI|nr:cytoplasmic tyrosine-tRNA ligase [Venturia nashicola]TLD32311.1 Tyrosine-tRNA ligase [Venturia nashicola]
MKVPTALIALSYFAHLGLCVPGTATTYNKQPFPNKCYGYNTAEIPLNGLYGAVGLRFWDGNAACGRKYQITCIGPPPGGKGRCTDKSVVIKVVEGRLGSKAPDVSLGPAAAALLYTGGGLFGVQIHEV